LHKAGDAKLTGNFRPIANLPSMSKLFEKIILSNIIQALKVNISMDLGPKEALSLLY
jgi:hypothetical protein